MLVVIPLYSHHRDSLIPQELKSRHGVIHSLRVNIPAVKEIPYDEHEVYAIGNRMILDDIMPGAKKVFGPLIQIVAATAQMYVRDM
jgi:hypothetical protein